MQYQVIRFWANGRTVNYGDNFRKTAARDKLYESLLGDEHPFRYSNRAYGKHFDGMQIGDEDKIYPGEDASENYFAIKCIGPANKRGKSVRGEAEEPDPEEDPSSDLEPIAWRQVRSGLVAPFACIVSMSTGVFQAYKERREGALRQYLEYEKGISQSKGRGDLAQFTILARHVEECEPFYNMAVREYITYMTTGLGAPRENWFTFSELCSRTYLKREVNVFVFEEAIDVLLKLGDFNSFDLLSIFRLIVKLYKLDDYDGSKFVHRLESKAEHFLDMRVIEILPEVFNLFPSMDFFWELIPVDQPFTLEKIELLWALMIDDDTPLPDFLECLLKSRYSFEQIEVFVFRGDEYTAVNYNALIAFYTKAGKHAEWRRILEAKAASFPEINFAEELAECRATTEI